MTDRKKLREFLEAVAGNGALDASATSPATVLALLKELDAKDARIAELEASLKPVCYYDESHSGDFTLQHSIEDIADPYPVGEITEVVPVATLPHKFAVWLDDRRLLIFDTVEEAEAALAADDEAERKKLEKPATNGR